MLYSNFSSYNDTRDTLVFIQFTIWTREFENSKKKQSKNEKILLVIWK